MRNPCPIPPLTGRNPEGGMRLAVDIFLKLKSYFYEIRFFNNLGLGFSVHGVKS